MKALLEKFGGRGLPYYSRVYDDGEVYIRIWKMAREDETLGQLFFDQLKARPRDLDPEIELKGLEKMKQEATFDKHTGMWMPKA